MATGMEYESPYKSDSPFSYEVEEGELSSRSGRSSPGTVRDNASDCGTQTDDQMENISETVTTMRVHMDNTPQISQTPQDIARKLKNRFDLTQNRSTTESYTSPPLPNYPHQCDRHHSLIILQNNHEHKIIINNNCLQLIVGQTI